MGLVCVGSYNFYGGQLKIMYTSALLSFERHTEGYRTVTELLDWIQEGVPTLEESVLIFSFP